MELVKISIVAKQLGVSPKTIYNWISDGRFTTVVAGYVPKDEAYEIWEHMRTRKNSFQSLLALHGVGRDSKGRFISLDKSDHK